MIAYRPYLAQAPVAPTTPIPALMPPTPPPEPKKEVNLPLALGIGLFGGALLGFLATLVAPKILRNFHSDKRTKVAGTLGGAIGGLTGTGMTLLLKD